MKQYCIYTRDMDSRAIAQLQSMGISLDIHLNRTRFYLDPTLQDHREFWLAWSHLLHCVDTETNPQLGV